jgi:UDP-glucose 4-epimerase
MKIFVVGGAGYIGSICVELLLDEGHDVIVFDRGASGGLTEGRSCRRRSFAPGGNQPCAPGDQTESVMHFAANALVGESMQNPSKYFRNNVAGGINLLDAMLEANVRRLVFSSTCATFGPPDASRSTKRSRSGR